MADWVLKRIQDGKEVRLRNAVLEGDIDLNKLDLPTERIERTELQIQIGLKEDVKIVSSSINIINSTIRGILDFRNSTFNEYAWFDGAIFCGDADFDGATFSEDAGFNGAIFSEDTRFDGATFCGCAWFVEATFSKITSFFEATFSRKTSFFEATFSSRAWFLEARFEGDALTFQNATFFFPDSMEEACRRAKNVLEKNGNREEAGYHFYREMEAKRIQKGIRGNSGLGLGYVLAKTDTWPFWKALWYDGIEYVLVQGIFGYGVHPRRLIVSWFSTVIIFAIVYWATEAMKGGPFGIFNYLEGSFATSIAPGYIAVIINGMGHTPMYHAEAILETIMGTFLWAGFIATFAKRYMK